MAVVVQPDTQKYSCLVGGMIATHNRDTDKDNTGVVVGRILEVAANSAGSAGNLRNIRNQIKRYIPFSTAGILGIVCSQQM